MESALVPEPDNDVARYEEGLASLQRRMWRLFIGACMLSLIVIYVLVMVVWHRQNSRALVVCLASLLVWSGAVTVYAFHSLHAYASQIKDELARKTFTDEITQVFNIRYLQRRLEEERSRVDRHGGTAAVLYIDLDHFKQVNDTHGHHVGNVVLRELANRMASQLRVCDVLGRVGGDEFVVLLPHTDQRGAKVVADRLVRAVADYSLETGDQGTISFVRTSVGVAVYPDDGDTMESVVKAADAAVYEAKARGGNMACLAGAPAGAGDARSA